MAKRTKTEVAARVDSALIHLQERLHPGMSDRAKIGLFNEVLGAAVADIERAQQQKPKRKPTRKLR